MSHYDYKVVPAPKRAKKVKGVRTARGALRPHPDRGDQRGRPPGLGVRPRRAPARRGVARLVPLGPLGSRRCWSSAGRARGWDQSGSPPSTNPRPTSPRSCPSGSCAPSLRRGAREPSLRVEPLPPSEAVDPFPTPLRPPPRVGPADQGHEPPAAASPDRLGRRARDDRARVADRPSAAVAWPAARQSASAHPRIIAAR